MCAVEAAQGVTPFQGPYRGWSGVVLSVLATARAGPWEDPQWSEPFKGIDRLVRNSIPMNQFDKKTKKYVFDEFSMFVLLSSYS